MDERTVPMNNAPMVFFTRINEDMRAESRKREQESTAIKEEKVEDKSSYQLAALFILPLS